MSKYLDKAGLQKLVDNIKEYIDNKISGNTSGDSSISNESINKIISEVNRITEFSFGAMFEYSIDIENNEIHISPFNSDMVSDEEFIKFAKDIKNSGLLQVLYEENTIYLQLEYSDMFYFGATHDNFTITYNYTSETFTREGSYTTTNTTTLSYHEGGGMA